MIAILLVFTLSPLFALVNAWLFAALWDATIAVQCGSGPSALTWYGISLFLGYAIGMGRLGLASEGDTTWRGSLARGVIGWLCLLFMLACAYFVRYVLGW